MSASSCLSVCASLAAIALAINSSMLFTAAVLFALIQVRPAVAMDEEESVDDEVKASAYFPVVLETLLSVP